MQSKANNENEWVEHLLSGDTRRFGLLYDRFSSSLYGVICKIVNDERIAEDIIQEAFVKIWTNASNYNPQKARLFTWILNIARNTAIDYLRSKQGKIDRKAESVDRLLASEQPQAEIHHTDEHIGIKRMVENLKTDHLEVIHLSFYEGYSQSEIAEKLSIPLGTVKTRCRSALTHLRKKFEHGTQNV
jgi:RNA polymerase sigma-70 factor, ECF subfamily